MSARVSPSACARAHAEAPWMASPLESEESGKAVASGPTRETRRFRAATAARATFSLRAQRESSRRERAPRGGAFRPSMDGKSVSRGRAFRPDSCPVEKALPSMATPAARPGRPRLTDAEEPRVERARDGRARSRSAASSPRLGSRFCAQECAALRGPYDAAGGWRIVRRMACRDVGHRGAVFSWLRLVDSGHPALCPGGPASPFARAPARAWPSKREVARPPAGGRNRFGTCEGAETKASFSLPDNDAAGEENSGAQTCYAQDVARTSIGAQP
jgi:hypothetical protein